MKTSTRIRVGLPLLGTLLAACSSAPQDPSETGAEPSADRPVLEAVPALAPRAERPKPAHAVVGAGARRDVVVVKMREGTHVRLERGALRFDETRLSSAERTRFTRAALHAPTLEREIAAINGLHAGAIDRLFSRSEADLDHERAGGEARGGVELADLNLYYRVDVQGRPIEDVLDALNAMSAVEIAYAQPVPQLASADLAPTTPSFTSQQGYLGAAPAGIDANYAWTVPGGRGRGVKIIDVEKEWQKDHEDFPTLFYQTAAAADSSANWRLHGTAVVGILGAPNNGFGVTGIAHGAAIGVQEVDSDNVADAINTAAAQLSAGDIINIEFQFVGPSSGTTCTCNCGQFEMVPVEWQTAEFDAIQSAVSKSLIVMEPAGNGSMNLDDARYNSQFDRTKTFSGAIMVGAGTAADGTPECWTNYGSRVDLHGWGDSVTTLHYGDLAMENGSDQRQWYTSTFSGTSSATPIVAGAVATIQGIEKSRTGSPLTAAQLTQLFGATGTPQASSTKHIGPLPNLRAAIARRGAPGSLVSFSDQCLDIQGGGEYGPLQTYGCTGNANQRFSLVGSEIQGAAGGCVDIPYASTADGTQLQTYTCSGASNQQWHFTNAEIKTLGKCLDVPGGVTADGTPIQIFDCNGGSNQAWTFTAANEIRGLGKCLAFQGTGASGSAVVLTTCTGDASQHWARGSNGFLYSAQGKCVDVPGASSANGTHLQVFDCNGGENQRFALYGEICGLGGKCMDVRGAQSGPGAAVQLWTRTGNANQWWLLAP